MLFDSYRVHQSTVGVAISWSASRLLSMILAGITEKAVDLEEDVLQVLLRGSIDDSL